MIFADPNDQSKSILSASSYFNSIIIPDDWNTVEDFFNWYILDAKMPLAIPWDSEIIQTEDSTAISIFKKGQYQVELILKKPTVATKNHCHPNMESITLNLGGGHASKLSEFNMVSSKWGSISWRHPLDSMHSELRTNPDNTLNNYSILSFQRWIDSPVKSALTNWKGTTSGPLHDECILRANPGKFAQSGYADVTLINNTESVSPSEDIFLRDQTFVVFHPGASGNFLSNLIRNLKNNSVSNIKISPSGSCHTMSPDVQKEIELFSCGIFLAQQTKIKPYSFDNRVSYYQKQILEHADPSINTGVSWTHDFTNIPVYRALFPNSKILVVTQESPEEKMCVTILQQLKNILSEDALGILSENARNQHSIVWEEDCREILESMVGTDYSLLINTIFADRFNTEFIEILTYVSVYRRLRQANMLGILDDVVTQDTMNYNSYYTGPADIPKNKYILAGPYSDYVDDECVLLPYKHIMKGNITEILNVLTDLLGTLTDEQTIYAISELGRYKNNQPKTVLDDPIGYIKFLKNDVIRQMSVLLDKYE
jgi:hypothetical protein